jgi:hypothetical protein
MPHLDVTQASVSIGILCTAAVALITIARQRRFEPTDLGSFIGVFFSGMNIPPALFLCFYVFMNDTAINTTLLKGYEKYISVAGLVLFLASTIGVWTFCKTAWKKSEPQRAIEAIEPANPPSKL